MGVPKPSCSMWRPLEWKLQPQPKTVQLRFLVVALAKTLLGLCWAHVGSSDGLYRLPWRFLEGKNQPQRESLSVEVHFGWLFGTMSGQCWAMLGRFGSMLGPCWVIWWLERSFQKLLHESLFGHYGNFHASIQIAEHMVLEPPVDLEPHSRENSFSSHPPSIHFFSWRCWLGRLPSRRHCGIFFLIAYILEQTIFTETIWGVPGMGVLQKWPVYNGKSF